MKISAIELQKTDNKEKTSFSGLKRTYDNDFEDVYKFYAPPYDKSKYALVLQLCAVKEDGKGGFELDTDITKPFTLNKSYKELRDLGTAEYPRTIVISDPECSEYMGYRFRLVDKNEALKAVKNIDPNSNKSPFDDLETLGTINDPGVKIKSEYGDFTVISNNMGVTPKSGSAAHIFYDSFDSQGIDRSSFVRNHFNKAGGDLDGIVKYRDEIEPYRYVMTNPYFGRDSKSSHKYWGENFFQVPSVSKFKEVLVDLYKEGKGYIADGAFTSQSIQSPMFQNVLKYGKDSPFYHWFKINGRLRLGVLPDPILSSNPKREKAFDHIGFKIVNPRGTKDYNPKKPSYIQFFDDRLASDDQQRDTKNLITRYANSNPKDHFDVTTHQDSVLPYYFELDYTDKSVRQRFSGYSRKMLNDPEIKNNLDSFFSFKNYDIVRKGRSGGANFWDGNVDLVKMNLSNPNVMEGNVEGYYDAREHLYSVATYWTQFAHDTLFEYLAQCFSMGEKGRALVADIAKKNGVTPQELQLALEQACSDEPNSNAPVVSAKAHITDIINNFRYETLDVSPQIQAMFSMPEFGEYMKDPQVKNRLFNFTIETLRKLDCCTSEAIIEPTSEINDILSTESSKREEINNGAKLTTYGQYMANILAPKIISYAVLKAMFPQDSAYIDSKDGMLKVSKAMRERSAYEAGVMPSGNFKDEALQLGKIIYKHLDRESSIYGQQMELAEQIASTDVSKYKLDGFQMAESLLKLTGGGLNWRFDAAKDIGDLNTNRNGLRTFEDSWDDVIEFWGEFIKNVREINPSSYIIAEVTDLYSFYENNKNYRNEVAAALGSGASETEINNLVDELISQDWGKYKNPETAERMFYEKTGATTGSNYSVFFGLTPNLFGQNFEKGNVTGDFANMKSLESKINEFLNSGPLLYLTHSHIFVDNHDKPLAPFCLALDMGAYLSRFGINSDSATKEGDIARAKEAAVRVLGYEPENYDKVSSKAVVVGDFLRNAFAKELQFNPDKLEIINEAIADLATGQFKTKIHPDFLRAESFGQNPFDISIKDIMQQAKYLAERDNIEWFSDEESKKIQNAVFKTAMEPALQKMTKMSDFLNSITGVPFFFAGDNMGSTGYEYASKNISVANRNLVHHEWIQKDSKEYKPEIREYYDRMQASAGLYKQYGLSAIAGGMPVSLPQESGDLYAMLKYDDKGSNVLHVFSNAGMTSDPYSKMDENGTIEVQDISLKDVNGVQYGTDKSYFYRKVYQKEFDKNGEYLGGKFVDETDSNGNPVKYFVIDGKLRRADGKKITINDTVTTFYKPINIGKVSHKEIMSRFFAV